MTDTISIPTPKFKQGDQVYYIRSRDGMIFEQSHIVGWRVVYFSHGYGLTYYSVEFYDVDQDPDRPLFEPEVHDDMVYDNLQDARRKQRELLQKRYDELLEKLETLQVYIKVTQTEPSMSETQQSNSDE